MEYFKLFNEPVRFRIDEPELRKKYLALSRQYHPDFYSLASEADKEKALLMSTEITNAYNTLRNPSLRLSYILKGLGIWQEDEKYTHSPVFLMSMMDLHEAIELVDSSEKKAALQQELDSLRKEWEARILPVMQLFDDQGDESRLQEVVEFDRQLRYLDRLCQQLELK